MKIELKRYRIYRRRRLAIAQGLGLTGATRTGVGGTRREFDAACRGVLVLQLFASRLVSYGRRRRGCLRLSEADCGSSLNLRAEAIVNALEGVL